MRIVVGLPLLIVTVALLAANAQEDRPANKVGADSAKEVEAFMRLKLEHSQKLLEGVTLADFGSIKKHAQKLGALSQDENWRVVQTREYRESSSDFQKITERMSKAADEQNLDAATLAYVQLTLNCVDCHKHVRDQNRSP
jgi:hypothetical protein